MKRGTIESVEHACMEEYILTGKPQTIVMLAKAANRSEQSVRNAVRESSNLTYTKASIKIMSRDYPHMVHQVREVDAYWPRRAWLRQQILTQRLVTDHKVQYGH